MLNFTLLFNKINFLKKNVGEKQNAIGKKKKKRLKQENKSSKMERLKKKKKGSKETDYGFLKMSQNYCIVFCHMVERTFVFVLTFECKLVKDKAKFQPAQFAMLVFFYCI